MWFCRVDPLLRDGPSATFEATRWSRDVSTWFCSECVGLERGFAGDGESRRSRCSVGDRVSGLQLAGRWPAAAFTSWSLFTLQTAGSVSASSSGLRRAALRSKSVSCDEHARPVAFVATRAWHRESTGRTEYPLCRTLYLWCDWSFGIGSAEPVSSCSRWRRVVAVTPTARVSS
jgi:hypothetical protein